MVPAVMTLTTVAPEIVIKTPQAGALLQAAIMEAESGEKAIYLQLLIVLENTFDIDVDEVTD